MRKKESVLTSSSFTSGRSDEKLKKAKLFFQRMQKAQGPVDYADSRNRLVYHIQIYSYVRSYDCFQKLQNT